MKLRAASLVALLLVASSIEAEGLKRAQSKGRTIGDMIKSLPKPEGGRRKVINLDSASDTFLFAAAGKVQGAGGTFFRSDVTLNNHRSTDQNIGIGYLAQGVDNSAAPLDYFVLDANTPVIQSDFVGFLGKSGLGAVVVFGVLSNGDTDTNAQLDGFSRIWTPQPGGAGSVSQGFPSVAFLDSIGSATAFALGGRHDSQFRTNAGIVNLDSVAHTWEVDVNGLNGRTTFSMTVPPYSMKQQVVPSGNFGDLVLAFTPTDSSAFLWSAYLAGVDNASGDSWSSHASQP